MPEDNNRWKEFNSIIDNEKLNIKEKGLLLILFRYVNSKTKYANPSRALIKKLYGTEKNDVLDKVINSLIEKGFLTRQSGNGVRSKYFIKVGTTIEPSTQIEPSSDLELGVGTQIEPTVGTQIEPQKEDKKKIKENIYIQIEEIRKYYHGKKCKQSATKLLPELIKKYGKDQLINGIKRYEEYVLNTRETGFNLQFKNESTYWNNGYIDYLNENYIPVEGTALAVEKPYWTNIDS